MNSIYFELNSFKIFILSCTNVADDVAWTKKRNLMVTFEIVTCHTCVHVCACACAHVGARVCM